MWILIYLYDLRPGTPSLQWHKSCYCTVNIHQQPSPSTKIAILVSEKVCEIELGASVSLDSISLIDMDMCLDKIVLKVLACLEGPE